MERFDFSFLWVIAISGALSLLIMLGNIFGLGLHRHPGEPRRYHAVGDPQEGRVALERYGCGACHRIPGVREANGRVGPSLEEIDRQIYIAGSLPNSPENLMLWIMSPQSIDPESLMPNLNVSRKEAEDMTAYLYAQSQSPIDRMVDGFRHLLAERVP